MAIEEKKYLGQEAAEQLIQNLKNDTTDQINKNAVLYSGAQVLTDEQKAQARDNIGAGAPQIQADWDQADETALDYIKNKPDESDALELVAEMGFVEPIAAADGSVYIDENGAFYTLT